MKVAIQIPDGLGAQLSSSWGDLERHALEALASQAYRQRLLTSAQVGELLGHDTRWQTEDVLRRHGADFGYDADELASDLRILGKAS